MAIARTSIIRHPPVIANSHCAPHLVWVSACSDGMALMPVCHSHLLNFAQIATYSSPAFCVTNLYMESCPRCTAAKSLTLIAVATSSSCPQVAVLRWLCSHSVFLVTISIATIRVSLCAFGALSADKRAHMCMFALITDKRQVRIEVFSRFGSYLLPIFRILTAINSGWRLRQVC